MRSTAWCLFAVVLVCVASVPLHANDDSLPGVLVASAGDSVFLASPMGGAPAEFSCGQVGWLYPAPGGVLFAPDLVRGKTSVIDLLRIRLLETLDGVTMPHFGESPDRYLVVAGDVMILSYPNRALVKRVEARINNPWQVEQTKDQRFVFVLDRLPDNADGSRLVAVDMISGDLSYRKRLAGDVVDLGFSQELGLLSMVDQTAGVVRLVTPGSLAPVQILDYGDEIPIAAEFVADETWIAVITTDVEREGGQLRITRMKKKSDRLEPDLKATVSLERAPVGLAVAPGGDFVAVALDDGEVLVFSRRKGELVSRVSLGEAPRHLVWCDPTLMGPLMPEWSEKRNELLEMEKEQPVP
ncbi:MAG: hypothetical protein GY906_03510 [bacterium]|nr:hypothetical protein [bacterium]